MRRFLESGARLSCMTRTSTRRPPSWPARGESGPCRFPLTCCADRGGWGNPPLKGAVIPALIPALPRVIPAATGLAVGEVERQQVLGEGAVGGRLVFGRV